VGRGPGLSPANDLVARGDGEIGTLKSVFNLRQNRFQSRFGETRAGLGLLRYQVNPA
jgi:hypothetical protein